MESLSTPVTLGPDVVLNSLFPKGGGEVKLVPDRISELAREVMEAQARSAPYNNALAGVLLFTICTWVVAPVVWIAGLRPLAASAKWIGGTALVTIATTSVVFFITKDDDKIIERRTQEAWRALRGAITQIRRGENHETALQNHFGTEINKKTVEAGMDKITKKWNQLFPNEKKERSDVTALFKMT